MTHDWVKRKENEKDVNVDSVWSFLSRYKAPWNVVVFMVWKESSWISWNKYITTQWLKEQLCKLEIVETSWS